MRRVVTTARMWSEAANGTDIVAGFDQEAGVVALARLVLERAEKGDEGYDVLRWLDRQLIRVATRFGEYQRDNSATFRLPETLGLLPQFVFHLRRSQFLQASAGSGDFPFFFFFFFPRGGGRGPSGAAKALARFEPGYVELRRHRLPGRPGLVLGTRPGAEAASAPEAAAAPPSRPDLSPLPRRRCSATRPTRPPSSA